MPRRPKGPCKKGRWCGGASVSPFCFQFESNRPWGPVRLIDFWVRVKGGPKEQSEPWWTDVVPRMPGQDAGHAPGKGREVSKLLEKMHELQTWLCDVTFEDGTKVPEVQLSLRSRGSLFQAQLKVGVPLALRLSVEAPSVEKGLLALEGLLRADPVPWDTDPYPLGGEGKKKK